MDVVGWLGYCLWTHEVRGRRGHSLLDTASLLQLAPNTIFTLSWESVLSVSQGIDFILGIFNLKHEVPVVQ